MQSFDTYVGFEVLVLLKDFSILQGRIISDSSEGETKIELDDGRIVTNEDCVFRLKEDVPPVGDMFAIFFG